MKKITKSTFKSFITKNHLENLYINKKSEFNGMIDGLENLQTGFVPAKKANQFEKNSLGIEGVWLVGHSRDYFNSYSKNGLEGIEVYNSCGHFIIAKKAA